MQTITINVPDGCEVQIVRKEEKKEPVIRTYYDLIKHGARIKGYYNVGSTIEYDQNLEACEENSMVTLTEKVAKSMLAMAMISQLMPYYGGEITNEEWEGSYNKYTIEREGNKIITTYHYLSYAFLAFHTEEQRDNFLKYNEQLVKDYLMID